MNEDVRAIEQRLARYQASVLAADVDAFMALYADDVQVFELWGQWTHDHASWRAMAVNWFGALGGERCVVDAIEVRTRVSGDMALLTAFLTYRAIDALGTELRSLDNRLSWVLRRDGERWQVLHEHTSVPIADATGQGLLKRS